MTRFYGIDEGWGQGNGYMNNINNTNFSIMAHNELMDQQVKENTANLNNLKTQTNIQTAGNELRKLGTTAMTGVGIKGVKEKYEGMSKAMKEESESFRNLGKSTAPKSSFAPLNKGGEAEARFFKGGGEAKWNKIELDNNPFDDVGSTGLTQEGKATRVQYFKDTEAGRLNFKDNLKGATRDNYFSDAGRESKVFDRKAGLTLEGDIVEARASLPSRSITSEKTGQKLFGVSQAEATRFEVDAPYFVKKPAEAGRSAEFFAPKEYFEAQQGTMRPKTTYGVASGTELPPRTSVSKLNVGEGGELYRDRRLSQGALSGATRDARTLELEAEGLSKAKWAGRMKTAGQFAESGVGKATRFAGIGASAIAGTIAISEDFGGRWGEFNTAQKWNNSLAIGGSALEMAGLATMNPVLEAGGLLMSLGAGIAGAVGEYQAGETSKDTAEKQTADMNEEAEKDKKQLISTTSYGNTGTNVSGRYDSRQRIGMAY